MNILVVEDQPTELKLPEPVLSPPGFEVDEAAAADEAVASIEEDPPNVILLDLSLPGVDGLKLARKLKTNPATPHILIVAVTSYPERFPMKDALEAGCDAYLPKPVSTRALPKTLAAVLENAESRSGS